MQPSDVSSIQWHDMIDVHFAADQIPKPCGLGVHRVNLRLLLWREPRRCGAEFDRSAARGMGGHFIRVRLLPTLNGCGRPLQVCLPPLSSPLIGALFVFAVPISTPSV